MVLLEDISDLIQIRSTDLQSLVRDSTICYHPSIFYCHMDRFVLWSLQHLKFSPYS